MASNAKYQRAPTEDYHDDVHADDYTNAPPAYAEGGSSRTADEEQGLFSGPRSSDDNIPDDFKVCGRYMDGWDED